MAICNIHKENGITFGDLKVLIEKLDKSKVSDSVHVEVSNDTVNDVNTATRIFADEQSIWIY